MKLKRLMSFAAAGILTVTASASVFADGAYTDTEGHWAANEISELSNMGIIQGNDGLIRPEDLISRAELVTVIYNMLGADNDDASAAGEYSYNSGRNVWDYSEVANGSASAEASDLSEDKWYCNNVRWAMKNGILTGYEDGTVKPENPVTRQETVVILKRGFGISGGGTITANDAASVSDWAAEAVGEFMSRGYMNGDNNGNVNPAASIKRGEAFKLLYNMIGKYITESGEYTGSYGNKLVIVKSGEAKLNGISSAGIVVGAGAESPEVSGSVNSKIKIFGRKKLRSKITSSGSSIKSGGSGSGKGSSSGGGNSSYTDSKLKLTFKANGGEFTDGDTEKSMNVSNGAKLARRLPSDPIRQGYLFKGWYETEKKASYALDRDVVDTDMSITSKKTLYAGWELIGVTFEKGEFADADGELSSVVRNYDMSEENGEIIISGKELKKYRLAKDGALGFWIGFDVKLSENMTKAIKNGEKLRYYIGNDEFSKNPADDDWDGYIEDELTGNDGNILPIRFDAGAAKPDKYFVIELPSSSKTDPLSYTIDVSKLELFKYSADEEPEEAKESTVVIGLLSNDKFMQDVELSNDLTKANTLNTTGTLLYVSGDTEENSGNFIELQITLGNDAGENSVIKVNGEEAEVKDNKAVVTVKVDSDKKNIVITADFDGEGKKYKEMTYTVVTTGLTLEEKPEEPDGGKSGSVINGSKPICSGGGAFGRVVKVNTENES